MFFIISGDICFCEKKISLFPHPLRDVKLSYLICVILQRYCKNIFEENKLKTVNVEASRFDMRLSGLSYDFFKLRNYDSLGHRYWFTYALHCKSEFKIM